MVKKSIIILSCLMAFCMTTFADTEQTVTVNGSVVDKFVTTISFNDSIVTLAYLDNTSETADMSQVSIDITYSSVETAITEAVTDIQNDDKVFNLKGQYMGQSTVGLSKGLYIKGGKKLIIK